MPSVIFNPIQANFQAFGNGVGGMTAQQQATVGGLLGLSAFGMLGYAAFFTFGAAAATPPALGVPAVVTFTSEGIGVGTATFVTGGVELDAGQMLYLAEVGSGQIALSNGAVAAILESWGLQTLSADAFVALAAYNMNIGQNPWYYGNFGQFMGNFTGPGMGGFATPPGFPDFPGGGSGWNPGWGHGPGGHGGQLVCVIAGGVEDCYYELF